MADTICAGGLIRNSITGKYVLVNQHNVSYSFPKGHVEEGETWIETALREIREETGLIDLQLVDYIRPIIRKSSWPPYEDKVIHIFEFVTDQIELTPSAEHMKAEWFEEEDLPKKLYHEKDREFILEYIFGITNEAANELEQDPNLAFH